MPTLTQTSSLSTYNQPSNESVRPWAEHRHHRYNSAFAPCLPYPTLRQISIWFEGLGSVNKEKVLDQIMEELVHCANFYFANLEFVSDRHSAKPKFADNLGWLIKVYEACVSFYPTESASRTLWVGELKLLTLNTFTNDLSLFQQTNRLPSFMMGVQCLLKQRLGLYWHLYRFQIETRAKRRLSASEYRTVLGRIRMDGQRHTLQWEVLHYLNDDYDLYPQTVGNARRSNDVKSICDMILHDPIVTAAQVDKLLRDRDEFFYLACRGMQPIRGRVLTGVSGIRYNASDRLVFENPN